ncbi:MAG: membrane protein insertase YidC [Oscillospiraceae bacterium]|nr:membrane protein insertase YidC [Oscillospiraceae bacterium]
MNLLIEPLIYVIDKCYITTGNFGIAIILFTLLTRVILFPISLISQKNSLVLFKLQPQLADLKARHSGEPGEMFREQNKLYKKEKYSTLKALLPLFIQIPIIIGVVRAVYTVVEDSSYDFYFLGLDLARVPTLTSSLVVFPILAALSSFLLCLVQNSLNPLTKAQGFLTKWGVAIFLTGFSGYFAFVCQASVGLYWVCGNVFSILVTVLCTMIYNPKKLGYNASDFVKPVLSKGDKTEKRDRKKLEKEREKKDMERFYAAKKQLVFFSEASGFWKYFEHFINYILDNSDITVHYLTADYNDRVFEFNKPRFEPYFCTSNGLISAFMKMDSDIVAMTMPDLETYHYKRSLVRKDIEYVYIDHGFGSFNMIYRKGALNNFDTIFCYGKNHNDEIKAMERIYNLHAKKLVNVGFGLLDMLIEQYQALEKQKNDKPQILIAPSWQKDNILEICLDELLGALLNESYKVILRPHPEFVKRFPWRMKAIFDKYGDREGDNFEIQTDFSSNSTIYCSDLIITDWSAIALEFSFTTRKPSLYINTPMKIMNPEWDRIDVTPIDIWIRDKIGVSADVDKLANISELCLDLIEKSDDYYEKITDVFNECIYHPGQSAQIGGEYLINSIKEKRK